MHLVLAWQLQRKEKQLGKAAIGCTAVQEGSVYLASATGNATANSNAASFQP